MPIWFVYALIAVVLYGVVGLFQKLATNRISAKASLLCCCVGYLLPVPYLLASADPITASGLYLLVGFTGGVTSQLGTWFLFASLARGAKASVAVTLTALYPLFTVLLATWLLGERLRAIQWLGVLLALAAGAMISCEAPDTKAPGAR